MRWILMLMLALAVGGCNQAPVEPEAETLTITMELYPVAGFDGVMVLDSPWFYEKLREQGRECGDPGDGWLLVPNSPEDCPPYYYMIDDGKGLICGPECATTAELNDMYHWLAAMMIAGETTMQEG